MGITLRSNIVEIWFLRKIYLEKQGQRFYRKQIMDEVKERYGIFWDQTFRYVAEEMLRPHIQGGCGLIKGRDEGGIFYEWITGTDRLCTPNLNVSMLEMYGDMSKECGIYTETFRTGLAHLYADGVEVYPIVTGRDYETDRTALLERDRLSVSGPYDVITPESDQDIPW